MRDRRDEFFLVLIIVALIAVLMWAFYPREIKAEPAYPVQEVPMDQMSDEMKEALIRSVITEEEEREIARMLYGEERQYGYIERAAVVWHLLNRIDSPLEANTVKGDLTHAHYSGYIKSNPVEEWAIWIVRDVVWRYACEKEGYEEVGRILPREFLYMACYKGHNRYRDRYRGSCHFWDWSIPSPYDTEKPWEE